MKRIDYIYLYVFFYTYQTFETILRSLYDLLGHNSYIHQPVTDSTIKKHSSILFEVNFLYYLLNNFVYSIRNLIFIESEVLISMILKNIVYVYVYHFIEPR